MLFIGLKCKMKHALLLRKKVSPDRVTPVRVICVHYLIDLEVERNQSNPPRQRISLVGLGLRLTLPERKQTLIFAWVFVCVSMCVCACVHSTASWLFSIM